MSDPRDYKLDISGLDPRGVREGAEPVDVGGPDGAGCADTSEVRVGPRGPVAGGRPYLRVHFACCHQYLRIYRSADGRQYAGQCPKCGKPVRFVVGPGGTTAREFTVY